jgi:ABC-2 type transport system ATP-binding protein
MIQCEHVKKEYGRKTALADFSAEFETGKIIGLLGPNGSGKTTLIKILAGLLTTEEGVVRIDKKPIGVDTKRIVSYLPERRIFPVHFG